MTSNFASILSILVDLNVWLRVIWPILSNAVIVVYLVDFPLIIEFIHFAICNVCFVDFGRFWPFLKFHRSIFHTLRKVRFNDLN